MKKFILVKKSTDEKNEFKTLQGVSDFLNVKYHQVRALLLLDDKVFLHKKLKDLSSLYKLELHND